MERSNSNGLDNPGSFACSFVDDFKGQGVKGMNKEGEEMEALRQFEIEEFGEEGSFSNGVESSGNLIRLRVIPKESLASALRGGRIKRFLNERHVKVNGIKVKDLAEQSRISSSMWNKWIREREEISRGEVNEIIGNIRRYEATVMVDELKNSWEARTYGFPPKTPQGMTKKDIIPIILEEELPGEPVECGLCRKCELVNDDKAEVLFCPDFAFERKAI